MKSKQITNKKTLKADSISFNIVSDQLGHKAHKLISNFANLLNNLSENVKKQGEQEAFKLMHKAFNLINEFHYIQDYNIPLGKTLDETDAHKLEYFTIIKNEMAVALKTKQDKDAKKN